jgi:acyl-CoA thioesterase I
LAPVVIFRRRSKLVSLKWPPMILVRLFRFVLGFSSAILVMIAMSANAQLAPQAVKTASQPGSEMAGSEKVVFFLGDSITAGYGVKKEEAFPDRVGEVLKAKGYHVKIINGGISGSVTAEADRRLRWFLRAKPDVMVLELGGNDALKGTPPAVIKKNLVTVIDLAQKNKVKVLLCYAEIYTNFGEDYRSQFKKIFTDLASEKKIPLVSFLLKDFVSRKDVMQGDGRHPNPKGHQLIGEMVAQQVEKLL